MIKVLGNRGGRSRGISDTPAMEHQHAAGADDAAEHHPSEQATKPWRRACAHVGSRQRGIVFASILLLVAPLSLHGDSVTLDNARMSSYSPHMRSLKGFSDSGMCRIGTASWELMTPAQSQLRLRGGKGEVSAKAQSKSTTRSGSPKGKGKGWSASTKVVKKKRLQKPHNLGPAEWMKKIKRPELQRREVSIKGFAKGRKKPVFHFWTKSKIKKFTEQRVAFRAKRRARFEKVQNQLEGCNKAEIIHCYARGWKTKFVKWLPSAAEQRALDETAAKEAEAAAAKVLEVACSKL